jgi:hypothetical protein
MDLKKPSSRLAFTIADSVKPKSRENVTADIKLGCFSITVLDSLCGMVHEFFKINYARHCSKEFVFFFFFILVYSYDKFGSSR